MDLKILYGNNFNEKNFNDRLSVITEAFKKEEKSAPGYLFSSSGRSEILGNHTDHNNGKVLVGAINCDILCVCSPTNNNTIKLCSVGFEPIIVDINRLELDKKEYGRSVALVKGVCFKLKELGYTFNGFTAYTTSSIFRGAGLSSSAAFEVLVCEIINTFYLNGKLTAIDKAKISQFAEYHYFGKPCGLLDQSGIALGSLSKIDFKDPADPQVELTSFIPGYSLVITNTGGNHANLTSHYAAIRTEMESIANYFGKKVLREIEPGEFYDQVPVLRKHFSGRAILRAIHFFNENQRVEDGFKALETGNSEAFLKAINGSGDSSVALLQNCSVPGEEEQQLMLGIEISKNILKDGACRVHGGGFAGSCLAVVSDSEVDEYCTYMGKIFGTDSVFRTSIRNVGTTLIQKL